MENYFDALVHLKALVVARRAFMCMGIEDDKIYKQWRAAMRTCFHSTINQNITSANSRANNARHHLWYLFGQIIPLEANAKHRNLTEMS